MQTFFLIWFSTFLVWNAESRDPRSAQELTRCVRMAEPLIHDPQYVFPLTVAEIKNVCQMWDEFVECVRKYTTTFLTQPQQSEFEKTINPSLESIHQLCTEDPKYEKAYLQYAPCMKKISIEKRYCGNHYNLLARIAESSSETGPAICCGYHKFRTCVLQEASRECEKEDDPAVAAVGKDSTHFVAAMLNRALGFLFQKCSGYEPSSEDCLSQLANNRSAAIDPNNRRHSDKNQRNENVPNQRNVYNTFESRDRNSRVEPENQNASSLDNNDKDFQRPRTGSAVGALPENPWNAAGFLPSPNVGASSSSKKNPPVTLQPRLDAGINKFTWTTSAPRAFFPTSANDFDNEIPRSQRYKGSGEPRSIPFCGTNVLVILTATTLLLSKYFGQLDLNSKR